MAKPRSKSPDRQEVEATAREYRRTKDLALRDRLISQHLYLVQTVARRFSGMGEPQEDLLQEGAMGLINAVDLYDPDRGVQFSTYATHLVEGQIRHYLRDKGKLIKQPAWVQELTTKIMKATEALTQELDLKANVIWGARIRPDYEGRVRLVAIIAGVRSAQVLGPLERSLEDELAREEEDREKYARIEVIK